MQSSFRCLMLLFFLLIFSCAYAQGPQAMPHIQGESVAGHSVVFPDSTSDKVAVLIFGFTKASKTQTGQWDAKLSADYPASSGLEIYQLPVLEDVPRLIRGMVVSGIRKGTAESKRNHMVPILQHEAELKTLVHYKESDDAYEILLNRSGQIVLRTHGAVNQENYSRVHSEIDALLNQK